MWIKSLFKNGLIVNIFGAVFAIAIAILGWVAMPDIIANVSKKVNKFFVYFLECLIHISKTFINRPWYWRRITLFGICGTILPIQSIPIFTFSIVLITKTSFKMEPNLLLSNLDLIRTGIEGSVCLYCIPYALEMIFP